MKTLTMQDINAYLDNALGERERRDVEFLLARDPAAQAMVNRYRRQVDELRRLYDPVLSEPVPPAMLSLLRGDGLWEDGPSAMPATNGSTPGRTG
ncbi:MAG: hypothetical protein RLY86_2774 [Pseudomonadota bacterium]|jgi:anti-sigma factor RsiW